MSVSIANLFNYSRSLPPPFDTITNKKIKVASVYGEKTESTLCATVIKAVHAFCRCMNGSGEGAVGMVQMALDKLNENEIVELDEERKAAMVSNLLVVLCGNKDAQPIVNSGTIY